VPKPTIDPEPRSGASGSWPWHIVGAAKRLVIGPENVVLIIYVNTTMVS